MLWGYGETNEDNIKKKKEGLNSPPPQDRDVGSGTD